MSDTSNGRYDWEYFSYRLLPYPQSAPLLQALLYGQYDLPDGHPAVPLYPNPDYVSLVVMKFQPPNQPALPDTFFPIIFEWEPSDCAENTMSDSTGNILYVSQNPLQYDTTVCGEVHLSAELRVQWMEGVYTSYPSPLFFRGMST